MVAMAIFSEISQAFGRMEPHNFGSQYYSRKKIRDSHVLQYIE